MADAYNARIQEFNGVTWNVISLGTGSSAGYFNIPQGVASDPSGNIFVSDYNNNQIQEYVPGTGWSIQYSLGAFSPLQLAVDGSDDIFVGSYNNSYLYKIKGTPSVLVGVSGTGNGDLNLPYGVAVDNQGNIFVADRDNDRIQEFDSTGAYVTQFGNSGGSGQLSIPESVAVDNAGNVFVADSGNNRIAVFSYVP